MEDAGWRFQVSLVWWGWRHTYSYTDTKCNPNAEHNACAKHDAHAKHDTHAGSYVGYIYAYYPPGCAAYGHTDYGRRWMRKNVIGNWPDAGF